tara:strand:- start:389 stop:619 length:231 start_codon:yes stop_codon:yes gene_type:complete
MQTLVKDSKSIYLFEDDVSVVLSDTDITVGDPAILIIGDCSSTDTVLHKGVTAPDDWYGHKYTFDGTTWASNPDWS